MRLFFLCGLADVNFYNTFGPLGAFGFYTLFSATLYYVVVQSTENEPITKDGILKPKSATGKFRGNSRTLHHLSFSC